MTVFLTPEELATRLRKKKTTLQSWRIRGGGPPYVKAGHRTVLYRLEDVEAWEQKHIISSTAEEKQRALAI